MKVYRKQGDQVEILSEPGDYVEKGDYLSIDDSQLARGLIAQVIDVQYANVPGIQEEILRDVITESVRGEDVDPLEMSSQVSLLKDAKLLVCKIRGTIQDGKPTPAAGWLPSRTQSKIKPFPIQAHAIRPRDGRPRHISLGFLKDGSDLVIDARDLDGRLNIIAGKKGTGKSHLAKLLVLGLTRHGAPCLILDVNGEYVNLGRNLNGRPSQQSARFVILTPRVNLQFTVKDAGLSTLIGIMLYAMNLPDNSVRVFARIWHELERHGSLELRALLKAIAEADCHESIRDALHARVNSLIDSGLFTDDPDRALDFEKLRRDLDRGYTFVVNMKNQSSSTRRMIVELLLSKLTEILSKQALRALFLFAEEAHLYLRETYWDDVVTRMRHLGLFTTFITNQPDTVQESIYRQADNIFLFNFTNERDIEVVSRAALVDGESVKLLVRDLVPHQCLVIGEVVRNYPIPAKVAPLDVQTMGETRYFFEDPIEAKA